MRVLVTGGAGFIGSRLIELLLEQGDDVVCVDNMNDYYDVSLKEARLARFKDKISFYEIDICDEDALEKVFITHPLDAICHFAAQAGVRYSLEHPLVYADTNVRGTINLFECARKHGVTNIVLASSSSVYGEAQKVPFSEDDAAVEPISTYAATKRAQELIAHAYAHLHGLNITALRFFTVYGPYGRPDMALFKFVSNILAGKPIDIYAHGEQERDFTYVDDIVTGFLSALAKPNGFQIVNLGAGNPVKLMDFVAFVEGTLGIKAVKNMMSAQPGDVPRTYADISKAKSLYGYVPKVGIKEGVEKFVQWYKEYYMIRE